MLGRAGHHRARRSRASRPTTSSPRWPPRPRTTGYRVLVVTGDRDSLQLVSDDVTVLYPRKGVSELTRFTPEAVVEKYGLTPQQYPDFAALRGDPSDNLPGIPGVGEKTATKWIAEYGSLQALVDNVDTVKGKVGDALRANLSQRRAQPRAHRSGQGRAAGADPGHAADAAVGPRPDPPALRRPRVPGAARPAVRHAGVGRSRGRPGFRRARRRAGARRAGGVAGRAQPRATGSGWPWSAPTWRSTPTPPRWRSSPPTATAATSTPPTLHPDDEAALGVVAGRRRHSPRRCTRPSSRCTTSKAAAGRWPASPPTPRWPPTWCGPGSAASRSTTCRCAT